MEEKKQLGGKRKGAGRKPLLSKKKQYSFYIEPSQIIKFGGEEKFKKEVTDFIYNYNADKDYSNKISELNLLQNFAVKIPENFVKNEVAETVKIKIKRTPAHWVELRRACENADDYGKWLKDLEDDTFLTTREKSQIKQIV